MHNSITHNFSFEGARGKPAFKLEKFFTILKNLLSKSKTYKKKATDKAIKIRLGAQRKGGVNFKSSSKKNSDASCDEDNNAEASVEGNSGDEGDDSGDAGWQQIKVGVHSANPRNDKIKPQKVHLKSRSEKHFSPSKSPKKVIKRVVPVKSPSNKASPLKKKRRTRNVSDSSELSMGSLSPIEFEKDEADDSGNNLMNCFDS